MTVRFMPSLAAGLIALASGIVQAEVLTFAPLPMETPETVIKQFRPLLTYLEKQLGTTIKIEYTSNYAEILEKFRQGKIDMAYLGPLPYVALKEKFPAAQPLAHFLESSGKPSYTCAIITTADKPASLSNLKGKKFALTQPLSTCGYLATDGLLRKAGSSLDKNLYRYVDKHDEVALAVTRGEFDFGGLKTAIARKYTHMGVTVLAETAPLPSFAMIANGKTMKKEQIVQMRNLLTALQPLKNPADLEITQNWGANIKHGAVLAEDSDYEPVRKLRSRADIPESGNF